MLRWNKVLYDWLKEPHVTWTEQSVRFISEQLSYAKISLWHCILHSKSISTYRSLLLAGDEKHNQERMS